MINNVQVEHGVVEKPAEVGESGPDIPSEPVKQISESVCVFCYEA